MDNKELIRRCWLEAFNQGNMRGLDEIVDLNYTYHGPGMEINGRDGIKQFVATLRSGIPDVQMSMEQQLAEGDEVATRWRIQGTHKGTLFGVAPTGKHVTCTGLVISRIANGKIMEEWEEFNQLGMLQQMGTVPTLEQATT